MGRRASNICFWLRLPWGLWNGSKGQTAFNFNYKVNFKAFHTKLSVCFQKLKI